MAKKKDTTKPLTTADKSATVETVPYEAGPRDEEQEFAQHLHQAHGSRNALVPLRHYQGDFFVCDLVDASPKGDLASMEHPFFAMKAGDRVVRRYEHKGYYIQIEPGPRGRATIFDKDIWLYALGQMVGALNQGQDVIGKPIRFKAYDFLVATNRPTTGDSYQRLSDALARLDGTRIRTNIPPRGGPPASEPFIGGGLISEFAIERTTEGRLTQISVVLPHWLVESLEAMQVLTYHPDYFRLGKGIERRLYELARKHCGAQPSWRCSLPLLHKKTGVTSSLREFRRTLKSIVETQHIPNYRLSIANDDSDLVVFTSERAQGLAAEDAEATRQSVEAAFREGWEADYPDKKWPGSIKQALALVRAGA